MFAAMAGVLGGVMFSGNVFEYVYEFGDIVD
jgi:hypothetical protein